MEVGALHHIIPPNPAFGGPAFDFSENQKAALWAKHRSQFDFKRQQPFVDKTIDDSVNESIKEVAEKQLELTHLLIDRI